MSKLPAAADSWIPSARIIPARRGKPGATAHTTEPGKRHAMTWAQRLKRVFRIDIETCEHCDAPVKIIASSEDPLVIAKILEHLRHQDAAPTPTRRRVHHRLSRRFV